MKKIYYGLMLAGALTLCTGCIIIRTQKVAFIS